jgi:hypothetical protein
MKKAFLIVLALLLAMSFAVAEDIEVSHELVTEEVYPGESISVNVIVKNNQGVDDNIVVKVDQTALYPLLKFSAFKGAMPISDRKTIESGEEGVFSFVVYTRDGIEPDRNYDLNFKIKSERDPEKGIEDYKARIYVASPEELIKITTDLPDQVAPGREVVFEVKFRNQANLMVDPADLYIDSDLFSKYYSEILYPTPYEITKSLKFTPEPTAKPGIYQMVITAFKGKTLRGRIVKNFEVTSNPDIESKVDTKSGFLMRELTVTKYNKGNVNVDDVYEIPMTWFEKLMTNYNIEPSKIAEGKAEWMFTIQPAETKTLTIKTDYRVLFFTIIGLLILAIIMIYYMKRVVSIKKAVFKMRDEKGAVAEIKVLLHVSNKTSKPITQIKVVDILPNMLILSHEFGTLKPNKFQKGEKSSRLIWDIDELEPGEERVISYRAKPGLHVIGSLTLPASLLRYTNKDKRIIDMQSNKVTLFSPPPKKTEE